MLQRVCLRKLWAGGGGASLRRWLVLGAGGGAATSLSQRVCYANSGLVVAARPCAAGGKCFAARFATLACSFPRMRAVAGAKAKFRLEVFDFYRLKSARFSESGEPDVGITCRHFGVHRSYFYRWKKRYDNRQLSTLENKPTIPTKRRTFPALPR
ncbi:MAG: hypothetical protein Ta2A_09550 [Treponemataceae bacterium]|nr:MAG: hypothetical protein Ta2A_09550 [Treponemataceae bacterium]